MPRSMPNQFTASKIDITITTEVSVLTFDHFGKSTIRARCKGESDTATTKDRLVLVTNLVILSVPHAVEMIINPIPVVNSSDRTRTCDPGLMNPLLYQLSYAAVKDGGGG